MSSSFVVGAVEVVLTIICFGSTFVPIKKFDGGDGIFVQWIMCAGIFFIGFVVNAINGFGAFHPIACIGGFCWAIGNVVQVPTMRRLGMAVSILVWNAVNCLIGWAAGFFGWFGLDAKPASIPWLNFAGVFFILFGAILFALVRRTSNDETAKCKVSLSDAPLAAPKSSSDSSLELGAPALLLAAPKPLKGGPIHMDRIIGLGMALVAGIFFGFNVIPVMYIQDNDATAPANGLAYIFSHFSGIFFTSSLIFAIYAAFKKNQPQINPEIALPCLISGVLWAVAQSLFFAATEVLTSAVTYPVVSMTPGVVAALWSVFYFKEISGKRDLILLSAAIGVTLIGTACVGLSK